MNETIQTFIDQFEFGDDMKADIRELIFEHLKKHREKMVDGPKFD